MADVNLPSFSDLGQMEFMSPMAFQQAQNQIGLANQFQQQNLATGEQDLQAKTLANQFSQQANPMRLQGMGLENEGKTNANALSGVDARTAMALEPEAKAAKRQALLQKASEDELKQLMSTAEKEYMSDDPVVSKRGENKLLHTKAELTRRNAAQDAYTKAADIATARADALRYGADTRLQGTQETNASRERMAAAKEAALQAKAQGNPKTAEAAAVKFQMDSDMESDPVEKARLAQLSKQYGAYSMALKNAQAGTKPDMAQFGFSTNPVNMGVGGVNPTSTLPAPMRNNNPGALMPGGKLAQYKTPEEGIAALDQNLQKYAGQGINTVKGVISKWAPPNENDTTAYIGAVANLMGVKPDQPLDMSSPVVRHMLAAGIMRQENGSKAFSAQGIPQPSGQPTQASAGPANVPKAPAGRVVIYKDGKAIGSVPESQVEAAKQQGYSVK